MIPLTDIDLLGLQSRLIYGRDPVGRSTLFDPIRRKHIRTSPEEMVRQLWLLYLLEIKQLPPKWIAVERGFTLNTLSKRFDLVLYNKEAQPILLAEFKAPGQMLSQVVFDQIAQYNLALQIPFSLVSNGLNHFCFSTDPERRQFEFLTTLPF